MSEHDHSRHPLRERDLPNPELMLIRILDAANRDTVSFAAPEELDAPSRSRLVPFAVAAAIVVVALGAIGWLVLRPQTTDFEPAGRPAAPPASVTPQASPEPTPDAGALAPALGPPPTRATRPASPRRTPSPTISASPSPTPSATPTPTPDATPTASPAAREIPSINQLEVRRVPSGAEGVDWIHVAYQLCSGSGEAELTGPVVADTVLVDVTPPADMPPRLATGTTIGPNECIVRSDTVRALNNPTRFGFGVQLDFAADSPESSYTALYGFTVIV